MASSYTGRSKLLTRNPLGIHSWVGSYPTLSYRSDGGRIRPGSQQDRAFKPGNTTLRNPDVQPDVSHPSFSTINIESFHLQLPPEKRDKLIITGGVETLSGANAHPVVLAGQFYGSKPEPTEVYLGEARTDDKGHLVVLAGHGLSRSIADKDKPFPLIMTDFDSPDWIDDTCDGWISVEVKHSPSGNT